MKKFLLVLAIFCVAATVVGVPIQAQNAEEAAVRQALDYYLRGHATGEAEHFKKVFHPEAKLSWIREGQFSQRTSADYIAGASGKAAPDEAQRKRAVTLIDITGNAAVAKIVLDYPNALITDYISLLKVDGEWKIVNKIFYIEPKNK